MYIFKIFCIIIFSFDINEFDEVEYSQNSSNNQAIYSVNSSMNTKYYQNIDIFKDPGELITYSEFIITDCVWPEYDPLITIWDPVLPEFTLQNETIIHVGANLNSLTTIAPFSSCQNAKFLIRVWSNKVDNNNSCITPAWISVSEANSTVIVDSTNLISVGVYSLFFESQLISLSSYLNISQNSINTSNLSNIVFLNKIWMLNDIINDWYLVVNVMKNFTISFTDQENDPIYVKVADKSDVNVFVQKLDTTSFALIMMTTASSAANSTISSLVTLAYYDKFHQDSSQWLYFNISLNIYPSEPPKFASQLQDLTIELCQTSYTKYLLPSIVDPDSSYFEISFNDNSHSLVSIVSDANTSRLLNTSSVYVSFTYINCSLLLL